MIGSMLLLNRSPIFKESAMILVQFQVQRIRIHIIYQLSSLYFVNHLKNL